MASNAQCVYLYTISLSRLLLEIDMYKMNDRWDVAGGVIVGSDPLKSIGDFDDLIGILLSMDHASPPFCRLVMRQSDLMHEYNRCERWGYGMRMV